MSVSTKTYSPKASELERNWRVIDATDRSVGRLASEVAQILKGKDKPIYTPHMDTGDFVIVVNASKIRVSNKKAKGKVYYTHSTYPGGLKATSLESMLARHPRRVIEWAVWGMLPKNRLGRTLLGKLKVYAEGTHPHGAQIRDMAGAEKVGAPGRPRPPKRVKVQPAAEPAPLPTRPRATAAEAPDAIIPEPEPVLEEQPAAEPAPPRRRRRAPAAKPAAQAPQAATPEPGPPAEEPEPGAVAEEAQPVAQPPDPTPLTPPAPRTRSRRARTQEAKPTRRGRGKKPPDENAGEQTEQQEA